MGSGSVRPRLLWVGIALASLALSIGAGLAAGDDPPRHAVSELEIDFPQPDYREPSEPGFFERHGGRVPLRAGTRCGDLVWNSGYPRSAGDIRGTQVDCETARNLIRQARGPCKIHGCHIGPFGCRGWAIGTQTVQVVCRDERSQVAWLWSGGY
jgi:hypothetical protein